jgi:hypothetical protein
MDAKRLCNLISNGEDRIQRRGGLLKDESDLSPPHFAEVAFRLAMQVTAFPKNLTGRDTARRWNESENGVSQHRLAATRFAHQADGLAPLDRQVEVVDGTEMSVSSLELSREPTNLE